MSCFVENYFMATAATWLHTIIVVPSTLNLGSYFRGLDFQKRTETESQDRPACLSVVEAGIILHQHFKGRTSS
jgi:uncharacterized protein (DUF983 family)